MIARLCGLAVLLWVAAAAATPAPPFSNAAFDEVLRAHVDDRGLVDYAALKANPQALDRYYAQIVADSPDATPALFPTRQHALAYWINAYNAAVLRTVVEHYPIAGVGDVVWWAPGKTGFFVVQRLTFGGTTSNLYDLEHTVVRGRYHDPRVHFALNCASRGCPRLPRQAFDGATLDAQLDAETRRFVGEERNVRVDHATRTVHLSSIFDWYESDFLDWPPLAGRQGATLLDYIALSASPERAEDLRRAAEYEIEFVPYDWRLNDRRGG
jgi:hypothetical protein